MFKFWLRYFLSFFSKPIEVEKESTEPKPKPRVKAITGGKTTKVSPTSISRRKKVRES